MPANFPDVKKRNAVVFGAGRIGRGFLGQLLFEGGCAATFVDSDAALVAALNRRGEYRLRLVSEGAVREMVIGPVRALDARDTSAITGALARADLAATAVGIAALPEIAPALAAGLLARIAAGGGPLNVLLCENQWHSAALVRGLLRPYLPADALGDFHTQIGLVETVVGRMVPAPPPGEDPLLIVSEPYQEWPIACAGLRGPIPPLPGIRAVDNFEAYDARKLFLHNAGHAALAYLGHRRGHTQIWQCVADEAVAGVCRAALSEASQALAAEYGFTPCSLQAFCEDLMHRFANKALGDTVARVAADPRRKLRPNDRLIGAANLCHKHGIAPEALSRVIAAAREYAG